MLSMATRLNVPRTLGPRTTATVRVGHAGDDHPGVRSLRARAALPGPQTENVLEHLPEHRRPIVKAVRRSLTYTQPMLRQDTLQKSLL